MHFIRRIQRAHHKDPNGLTNRRFSDPTQNNTEYKTSLSRPAEIKSTSFEICFLLKTASPGREERDTYAGRKLSQVCAVYPLSGIYCNLSLTFNNWQRKKCSDADQCGLAGRAKHCTKHISLPLYALPRRRRWEERPCEDLEREFTSAALTGTLGSLITVKGGDERDTKARG